MAIAGVTSEQNNVSFPKDSVVWPSVLEEYAGGVTVDVTGYPIGVIHAGQVVTKETATGGFALLPVLVSQADDSLSYDALPDGFEYAGCVRATKLVDDPFVSVVYAGTANHNAMEVPMTTAIMTAISAALPKLTFKAD